MILIRILPLLIVLSTHLWCDVYDDLEAYLERSQRRGMEESLLQLGTHGYYVLMSKENTPVHLKGYFEDEKNQWHDRARAIHVFGMLSSVRQNKADLDYLMELAIRYESDVQDDNALGYLTRIYWGIAYYGNEESLGFLIQRTQHDFWKDRSMPNRLRILTDPRTETRITAQSEVLVAIAKHPSDEAMEYLHYYLGNEIRDDVESDAVLEEEMKIGMRLRDSSMQNHENRQKAWLIRQSMLDDASNRSAVDMPEAEPIRERVEQERTDSGQNQPQQGGLGPVAEDTGANPESLVSEKDGGFGLWLYPAGAVIILAASILFLVSRPRRRT